MSSTFTVNFGWEFERNEERQKKLCQAQPEQHDKGLPLNLYSGCSLSARLINLVIKCKWCVLDKKARLFIFLLCLHWRFFFQQSSPFLLPYRDSSYFFPASFPIPHRLLCCDPLCSLWLCFTCSFPLTSVPEFFSSSSPSLSFPGLIFLRFLGPVLILLFFFSTLP